MSGAHALRSGFVTKSALPSVTRIRGVAAVTKNFNINAVGTPGVVYDSRAPRDESPSALTIYNQFGSNAQQSVGSASPYRPDGYWSCDFSGSNSYLQVVDSIGFLNFSGDFTLEAWVYLTATPGINGAEVISKFINGGNGWYALTVTQARTVTMRIWDATNVVQTATSTATVPRNTWVHISGGRNGSNITVSVAGTYTTAPLTITPRSSNSPVAIGVNAGLSANPFTGMISNVRATSYALYSANFTPNTTPVLVDAFARILMCNGPYFFNRGTNGLSVLAGAGVSLCQANPFSATDTTVPGSGSFNFDGSIDGWFVNNSAALDLTTGDWTCEGWFYATAFKATETIVFAKDYQNNTSNAQYGITVNATKNLVARIGTGTALTSTQSLTSTSVLQLNCWYHFAFVKSGTTLTLFLNGKQEATATQTATMTHGSYPLSVGTKNNANNGTVDFAGWIGDLRIVKSALYTSDFLPSLEKMTAVANTVMLLVAAPVLLDAASRRHQLKSNISYQTEFSPFGAAAPGSYYFPLVSGSTVSSAYPDRDLFTIGTEDFTMDVWLYLATTQNNLDGAIFTLGGNYAVELTSSGNGGRLRWRNNSVYRPTPLLRTDLINKWTHIAVTRQSGVMRFFVDGVQTNTGSTFNATTFPDASWTDAGSYAPTTVSLGGFVGGYLSYARLVVGQALYTSNFTVPASAPTADANTKFLMTVPNFGLVDSTFWNNQRTLTAIGTPSGNAVLTNATAPSGLTESFEFNGSRYLDFVLAGQSRLGFSTGNFTAECFVRVTATGSEKAFFGTNPPQGTFPGWFFGITSTGALILTRSNSAADAVSSALTWDSNTWYHVAVVRYGTAVRFYRNGALVSVATISASIGFDNSGGNGVMIGARHSGSTIQSHLTGYIAAVSAVASPLYLDATHTVPSLPLQPNGFGPNFVTNAVYGVNQLA